MPNREIGKPHQEPVLWQVGEDVTNSHFCLAMAAPRRNPKHCQTAHALLTQKKEILVVVVTIWQ